MKPKSWWLKGSFFRLLVFSDSKESIPSDEVSDIYGMKETRSLLNIYII